MAYDCEISGSEFIELTDYDCKTDTGMPNAGCTYVQAINLQSDPTAHGIAYMYGQYNINYRYCCIQITSGGATRCWSRTGSSGEGLNVKAEITSATYDITSNTNQWHIIAMIQRYPDYRKLWVQPFFGTQYTATNTETLTGTGSDGPPLGRHAWSNDADSSRGAYLDAYHGEAAWIHGELTDDQINALAYGWRVTDLFGASYYSDSPKPAYGLVRYWPFTGIRHSWVKERFQVSLMSGAAAVSDHPPVQRRRWKARGFFPSPAAPGGATLRAREYPRHAPLGLTRGVA